MNSCKLLSFLLCTIFNANFFFNLIAFSLIYVKINVKIKLVTKSIKVSNTAIVFFIVKGFKVWFRLCIFDASLQEFGNILNYLI